MLLGLAADGTRMDSVIGAGLRGVQTGLQNAARDAERVVRSFEPSSTEEPIQPLVDLQSDRRQVQASTAVIRVGDEILGSILDILG